MLISVVAQPVSSPTSVNEASSFPVASLEFVVCSPGGSQSNWIESRGTFNLHCPDG